MFAMLDGFPQPATQKRFEFAFFLGRGRLVRICNIGADAKADRFRFHG
jgi:hypothetical protein